MGVRGTDFILVQKLIEGMLLCLLLQIANYVEVDGLDESTIKSFFQQAWSEEIIKYQGKDETNRLTLPFTQYLAAISEVASVEEVSHSFQVCALSLLL